MGNTLVFKTKHLTRLAASRYFELGFPIKSRYLYINAEGSLGKVNRVVVENIITIPGEKFVRLN